MELDSEMKSPQDEEKYFNEIKKSIKSDILHDQKLVLNIIRHQRNYNAIR